MHRRHALRSPQQNCMSCHRMGLCKYLYVVSLLLSIRFGPALSPKLPAMMIKLLKVIPRDGRCGVNWYFLSQIRWEPCPVHSPPAGSYARCSARRRNICHHPIGYHIPARGALIKPPCTHRASRRCSSGVGLQGEWTHGHLLSGCVHSSPSRLLWRYLTSLLC